MDATDDSAVTSVELDAFDSVLVRRPGALGSLEENGTAGADLGAGIGCEDDEPVEVFVRAEAVLADDAARLRPIESDTKDAEVVFGLSGSTNGENAKGARGVIGSVG